MTHCRQWAATTAVLAAALLSGLLATPSSAAEEGPRDAKEYIRVEIKGRLQSGVVAIGGETTGTTITASGATWELDLGDSKKLRALAEENNGKTVVVTGKLTVRRGVEVRRRTIVTVESLKPAE